MRRSSRSGLGLLVGLTAGCGGEPAVETGTAALIEHNEDWDWIGTHDKTRDPTYNLHPAGSVRNAETAAEAVMAIGDSRRPFCTGFLVGPDLVMTADHCFRLDNGSMPARFTERATLRADTIVPRTFDCVGPVHLDAPADVVTLRCARDANGWLPGDYVSPVRLSRSAPAQGEDLFSVTVNCRCDDWSTGCGHKWGGQGPVTHRNAGGTCTGSPAPRADASYRLLSPGGTGNGESRRQQCRVNNAGSTWTVENSPQRSGFHHNCDSLRGSSGGPVFSRYTGEVVGVVSSSWHGFGSWNAAGEVWRFMRDHDANQDDQLDSEETNLGLGPWSTSRTSAFDVASCSALLTADVNRDGLDDWVCVRDFGFATTQLWAQIATPTGHSVWQTAGPVQFGTFDGRRCTEILLDDLNFDGKPDLVCPYDYGTQTRTFVALSERFATAYRAWTNAGTTLTANLDLDRCQSLQLADIEGDGLEDIVCAYDYGSGATMTWVQHRRSTGYAPWSMWGAYHARGTFDVGRCRLLAAADVDNDGHDELVCTYDYGWGRTRTFVQRANGAWGSRWQASGGLQYVDLARCRTLTLGRANADIFPDLICVESSNGWVTWTRTASGNSFGFSSWQVSGAPERFDTGGCQDILVADVDRDGRDDLVCPFRYPDGRKATFSKRSNSQGWASWQADQGDPLATGLDYADCAAFAVRANGHRHVVSCVEAVSGGAQSRTWSQSMP